ncbi:uncharacterized protein LOC121410103 isoform X2 [Lytechinus variegatus]|uniref:uncharacterized protein LOC121410103 isoform X2 n=1 Tax=Lytechinus variegatus TaxID=7654 RepID=UPI001BB1F669|nr:uncharacterized protein LOC121410103 isoform X2 [Lytechinus variegatus]
MSSSAELYQVGSSEKIKALEEELAKELQDLKNDIEENEMLGKMPKVASSVSLPKSVDHFRKQREQVIKRAMEVSEAQPLVIQADVMKEEMENCQKREFSKENLSLILHQFFCDKIQQLVQCKHMHMLRWKRFCEHTSTLEALYPHYQNQLGMIMSEYSDAIARAKRLSVANEALVMGKPLVTESLVTLEDMQIYTRWLVSYYHSVKRIHAFLKIIEWIAVAHKHEISPDELDESDQMIKSDHHTDQKNQGPQTPKAINRPGRWSIFDGRLSMGEVSVAPSPGQTSMLESIKERNDSGGIDDVGGSLLSSSVNVMSTNTITNTPQGAAAAAAAGGGPASNSATMGIPCHLLNLEDFKPVLEFLMACYSVHMNLDDMESGSDEMELISIVTRKFKSNFTRQEQQKTFPTYDKLETGNESWGADTSSHALLKESNWTQFIKLKPEKDPKQEKMMMKLRQRNSIDELLRAQSRFISVTDFVKVMDTLRAHAVSVREPPNYQSASVTSHRTAYNTNTIWRKIYCNPELFEITGQEEDMAVTEFEEKDVNTMTYGTGSRAGSATSRRRKKKGEENEFTFADALQKLGLEDDSSSQQDPTMVQGGYLSYLYLRHLRIRDLQRTCLSVLNYFRSIERTLTINDEGLSLEGDTQKRFSHQNHRQGTPEAGMGGGGGLGNHGYLHNTPAEFKLSESEFMEFSDIENHDDFYTIDEGRVHVQDQRGYYIIYHKAKEDMKNLETDLLLIATHFIEKDRENRTKKDGPAMSRISSSRRQNHGDDSVDIPSYGHSLVDRHAILLDLWTNEAEFLENKRQLLDVYLEAYHNVFDMHEKRALAQEMTNIIHKRPRFDFKRDYFVHTYKMESRCLKLHCGVIKSVSDKQIESQREYIKRITREGNKFGLPHAIVQKQPISINLSRPALKHVFLLEFHPSLALISRIPQAVKYACNELYHCHEPSTESEAIAMEKKLWETVQKEWDEMKPIGHSFNAQVQKDLFSDLFIEDPLLVCELAATRMDAQEAAAGRRTAKEKQADTLKIWLDIMETINLRHRLVETSWETEILSRLYREQAVEMGFDEFHMFMRCVQFEFATHKDDADQPPPLFMTALQEDDSNLDRYTPANIFLAIQELDEKHVGMFSFRSKEGCLKIMKKNGQENIRVILMIQVVHKNSLLAAIQQGSVCSYFKEADNTPARQQPINAPVETSHSDQSQGRRKSSAVGISTQSVVFAAKLKSSMEKHKRSPEAFVSLQLEKTPSRDVMLNNFLQLKASRGTIMKNPEEVEKLKRELIVKFCHRFMRRVSQYSLRGQIISYINSMMNLLDEFDMVKKTHFVCGLQNEKKGPEDDVKGLETNPRELKKRPRRLLSPDGTTLLNMWFLPHHTESLVMFKTLDEDTCVRALSVSLRIISSLHDILQYLCAHSKLGSSHARLGSQKKDITADWGGTEGICSELREIQKQINNMEDPNDPEQIADFLSLRRDILFLEFDSSIRYTLRDTLLSTKNVGGYRSVTMNMSSALPALSNVQRPTLYNTYMCVPEPLQPRDSKAQELFPYRTFLGRRGPFNLRFWQWQQIENNMQLCLSGLKDVDRHVANGEILGVSLLMEDVLLSGQQDIVMSPDDSDSEDIAIQSSKTPSRPRSAASTRSSSHSRPASARSGSVIRESKQVVSTTGKALSRTKEPVKAYSLLKDFLLLWKRLEVFKVEWGQRKLAIEEVNTPALYRKFCQTYKMEILYPVVKSIARRYGQGDLYEGMVMDSEPIVAPKGASEMELRAKQLVKLLDNLEHHMIHELQRKIAKEHALVVAERARDEGNLPTDLWKRPVINERLMIPKPHVADDFSRTLHNMAQREGDKVFFTSDQLNSALTGLANAVMTREKGNYENYSMYYENLLRQHHQLLYQREQEIKHLQQAYDDIQTAAVVDIQCQLADRSHDLLLEITALRSKLAEMNEEAMTKEEDIRNKVKAEYDALVQNLFYSAFALKQQFDEFGLRLHKEASDIVSQVRQEAVMAMSKFKKKTAGSGSDEGLQLNLKRATELHEVRKENNALTRRLVKMKSFNGWKTTKLREHYNALVGQLQHDLDRSKRDYLEIKMGANEEVILLRQQVMALRKALSTSEKEREATKKVLDKEMRIKEERKHREEQEARNQRQMELARAATLDRLMEEIEEKAAKLEIMEEDLDKTSRLYHTTQEKTRKEVTQVKSRLQHERNMKLDAFNRVDELQTQVYDYEYAVSSMSRPFTSMSFFTSTNRLPPMRSKSSGNGSERQSKSRNTMTPAPSTTTTAGGLTSFPPNYRSITPDPYQPNNERDRMTQRPKTVGTRLRNRIAEQLMTDLTPDRHETIMQLQAIEQQQNINTKYKV